MIAREREKYSVSRLGASAHLAIIYIFGGIIGTVVAASTAGACEPAGFPVAIDVGHDRDRLGAFSARGVPEFEFNLALAREVLARLLAAGFSRSFLIGESGAPLELPERTATARRASARVLVSIHHDRVQPRYLEPWTFQGRVREHTMYARGFSLFVSARNSFFAASKDLAVRIGSELRTTVSARAYIMRSRSREKAGRSSMRAMASTASTTSSCSGPPRCRLFSSRPE